jgi:hypothetical protein
MRLGKRGTKFMRTFHIITASIWQGSVVCLFALMCRCFFGMDAQTFLVVAPQVTSAFPLVVLPAALLTIGQGVIYGISGWGFARHRWVLLKWVAVFALIGLTGAGTITQMFAAIEVARSGGFIGGFADGIGPLSFTAAQVAIMVAATTLSVCKPALRKRGT